MTQDSATPHSAEPIESSSLPDSGNGGGLTIPAAGATPQDRVLTLIERAGVVPGMAAELKELMDLRARLRAEDAQEAFNAAKGRILAELAKVKIVKNRAVLYEAKRQGQPTGQFDTAFKYATLEDIDRALGPLLASEQMDLSYSDEPATDGRIMIRGRLKHLPLGHYEDSFMAAPLDTSGGKNNVQAVGSTNPYLRRYVAVNLFNIVVIGDDDDGMGGLMSQEQVEQIMVNQLSIMRALQWLLEDAGANGKEEMRKSIIAALEGWCVLTEYRVNRNDR